MKNTPVPSPSFRHKAASLILTACLAAGMSGCVGHSENISPQDKIAMTAVGGAIIGGLFGYEVFSGSSHATRALLTLGATAAGAYTGKAVGEHMTRFDRTAMQEAAYTALTASPEGQTSSWQNNATNTHGSITPLRTFLDSQGRICREYNAKIVAGGETAQGRETACQTEAGHWVVYATAG